MIKKIIIIIIMVLVSSEGLAMANDKAARKQQIAVHKISKNVHGSVDGFLEKFNQYGIDIDQQDKAGNTLLLKAAQANNLELVKYLLDDLMATADIKNSDGISALTVAAGNGWLEMTTLLLESGADPVDIDLQTVTNEIKEVLKEYGAW